MFGKKQSAEPAKVTSTSLAEEAAKIIDVFEKAVTNLKEVASRAQAEKEVREQEIIELQTEAANLEAVSNKSNSHGREDWWVAIITLWTKSETYQKLISK